MNLIKQALLGMENEALGAPPAESRPEERTILMQGALSAIYTKALDIQFAKPDPVSGTPAQESLATDTYNAAKAAAAAKEGQVKQPTNDQVVDVYASGTVMRTDGTPDEVIPVISELQSIGVPGDFVFVTGAMAPTDDSPVGGENFSMVEMDKRLPLAMEDIEGYSIVVRLKKKPV